MDRDKIIKLLVTLFAIVAVVGILTKLAHNNNMSLSEYAASKNPDGVVSSSEDSPEFSDSGSLADSSLQPSPSAEPAFSSEVAPAPEVTSTLIGASLNGNSVLDSRIEYATDFYYEPISDNLRRFMTGVSYPADAEISIEELRYVHILHYDFNGVAVEGELICNQAIAQDLVEIFYELYQNEYQLGSVLLIDEFDGDLTASQNANNSFCFYYSPESADTALSKHSDGLALDINPLYNPRISYESDGTEKISPDAATDYTDRSGNFPYKIDENDLCYKLFIKHGFIWGGNRNDGKAYQHFHKNL